MNLCEAVVLPVVDRIHHPAISLSFLRHFQGFVGRTPGEVRRLMSSPVWEARWIASQKIATVFSGEEAWTCLCRLAEDAERNVREGAAHGFGFLLARAPNLKERYKETICDHHVSEKLRRALLHSAVVLWRKFPEHLETATFLLEAAAAQPPLGCFQTIGAHLLAVELMKSHPQTAQDLKKEWASSLNSNLKYHAARADGQKVKSPGSHVQPEDWADTSGIPVPGDILSQVIGQDQAVAIIRIAARQRRFVLLMGRPGTGKSMLAQAMAEQVPDREPEDVMASPNSKYAMNPVVETVPAGTGRERLEQTQNAQRHARQSLQFLWWSLFAGIAVAGTVLSFIHKGWVFPLITVLTALVLFWFKKRIVPAGQGAIPKLLISHPVPFRAPFIDATGLQAGALFGDVRHDPFQSGGRETPPHQLLEPGAIHLANKGILFIDEAGTLSMESQKHLLTVIQEKKFPIIGRLMNSSGSMVRSEPVPCDFTLVLAGNEEDIKTMHPALRSRITGFGYEIATASMIADTAETRRKFGQFVAQEIRKDGKIPHFSRAAVDRIIEQAGTMAGREGYLSLRLRELGGLVRAAGDMAVSEEKSLVEPGHVVKALKLKKSIEEQMKEQL